MYTSNYCLYVFVYMKLFFNKEFNFISINSSIIKTAILSVPSCGIFFDILNVKRNIRRFKKYFKHYHAYAFKNFNIKQRVTNKDKECRLFKSYNT